MNTNVSETEAIEIYKEIINGKRKGFPPIFSKNIELIRHIAKYLFEEMLHYSLEDIYYNLTEKFLIKYKINNIVKRYFKSQYHFISFTYPEKEVYPWLFQLGARNYLSDDNEIKRAISWLIDKEKLTINDIYNAKVSRDMIKRNKLDSIFYKRFQNSTISAFDWYFKNFTDLEFDKDKYTKNKPKYFYEKEYQISLIKRYFQKLGFDETNISFENKKIIVNNFNRDTLYNICGGVNIFKKLEKSIYKIFKIVYPNFPLYQWELVTNNYWNSEQNRIKSIKELIEYENLKFENIPLFFTHDTISNKGYGKFNGVCDKYYQSDYFHWINEVFPNSFTQQDFHKTMHVHDGIKMHSKKEIILHDIFKTIFNKVLYVGKSNKEYHFYNEIENEKYIPDWILNDNIIVEYFGWYNPEQKHNLIINYTNKANRKIDFYNSLDNFGTLFIFPNDLKDENKLMQKIKKQFRR